MTVILHDHHHHHQVNYWKYNENLIMKYWVGMISILYNVTILVWHVLYLSINHCVNTQILCYTFNLEKIQRFHALFCDTRVGRTVKTCQSNYGNFRE